MVIGEFYTAEEVEAKTAGGYSYIRTRNNAVRGLAITLDMNPDAPNIVIVGDGERIKNNAELFKKTITPVKTFIKHDTNKWEYVGRYKVKKYSKSLEIIEQYRKHRSANEVTGILFLIKENN